ncbi:MAG TPA: acetate--CoA ligase family protein [Acidimicrobiia bacterium]|nr:acetate--CoA ligase family protein [Acidimicrobiia bacterium]
MSDLGRLLDPASIAIVGLSADPAKHGGRVLGHLRRLGYTGEVFGVNPRRPSVDGVVMFETVSDLPQPPDLVVCAIPAGSVGEVAEQSAGAGSLVVFAGGFSESGSGGRDLEGKLAWRADAAGVRVLGPNSGGVIRPGRGLAASFLTCLDRPASQIRSGPVGVVTQSGGTGSYLHNLAAARGSGLAVSVSTGNEVDIKLGEAIEAVSALDEVRVVLALIETVRDGPVFIDAVRGSLARGKPVVACRIGTGSRGKTLMTTHTGAMAVPEAILEGVLVSLGVVIAETPGEAYDIAEFMSRAPVPGGNRAAIVTHSGGIAIHLADLAERHRVNLPAPGPELRARLDPLLDHGVANNPLDMGGIIGGPGRFAEVVETFARSGEYDIVLAVSTAHPPAHTEERVRSLVPLLSEGEHEVVPLRGGETDASERSERVEGGVPVLHLWMAGDQAAHGLARLRGAGIPVTEEPRAAIRGLAGLAGLSQIPTGAPVEPLGGAFEDWGIPLVEGEVVSSSGQAVTAAEQLGYPVVVKVVAPGLAHKTELGGVKLNLRDPQAVIEAFDRVVASATAAGLRIEGARVERFRPGLEMIVGGLSDLVFGPVVSVGMGGVLTEVLGDVAFAPAPVDEAGARKMIDRIRARPLLDGYRGDPPADVDGLARMVSLVSRGLVGAGLSEVELNPVVWDGAEWVTLDLLIGQVPGSID